MDAMCAPLNVVYEKVRAIKEKARGTTKASSSPLNSLTVTWPFFDEGTPGNLEFALIGAM